MKSFISVLVIVQAVLVQNTHGQCIRGSSCIAPPVAVPTVPVTSSVANSLADTLSLLTVSSLLAETLPYTPNVIATVPVCQSAAPIVMPTPTVISGCGCGLTSPVINGCGCDLISSVINGCGCGLTTPTVINGCGCGLATPTVINGCGCGLGELRYGLGECGCSIGRNPGCGLGYGCNYWY